MDAEAFESIRRRHLAPYTHNYTERDVILYALALGARAQDLHLVYEGDPSFTALPMYSIIAAHPCLNNIPLEEYVPGFSRMRALHGEQYLRVLRPLPTHGQLITQPQLVDVRDKGQGKGAVIVVRSITKDALLGHDVAENEFVIYGLGAGGFGSPWLPAPRSPAAVAANQPPNRPPDKEVFLHTSPQQAAFYRLCGDLNPLHIDPAVAKKVGFSKPILHGLCTMGLSVKAVMQAMAGGNFGALRTAKVRFSKPCLPGDVLRVRMWKLSPTPTNSSSAIPYTNPASSSKGAVEGAASPPLVKVVFETRIMGAESKESTVVIAGAAVEFEGDRPYSKL